MAPIGTVPGTDCGAKQKVEKHLLIPLTYQL